MPLIGEKNVILLKGEILRSRQVSLNSEQVERLKAGTHLTDLDLLIGEQAF